MMLKNVKMPMTAGGGTSNRRSLKSALKRGFTIMELVIVIAVIAVLAAVLIPTFANITERANTSADTQTVKNLNTILISEETLGNTPATMAEALAVAESGGYKVENLTPTGDGNHIVWLKERNRFALLDEDGALVYSDSSVTTLDGLTAYKMSSALDDLENDDSFAYCFTSETEVGDGAVEVSRSADFSLVEGITGITVNNDSAMEITAEGEDIAVTVNGTATLGIYGTVGSISGEDYGNESLHIYGTVTGKIELAAGRVVAMPGSDINTITVTATSADAVKIERQSGSAISAIGAVNADVAGALDDVVTGDASDIDIPESAVSNDFAGGMGTEANPYLISTPAQLTKISNGKTDSPKYYRLINDIVIGEGGIGSAETGIKGNAGELQAVASLPNAFEIVLDGDNFTIYGPEVGLQYEGNGRKYIFGGTFDNVTVKNINFNLTAYMPTIAAKLRNECNFENVKFNGSTSWENNMGLFGIYVNSTANENSHTVTIKNCTNNANIKGAQNNALIVGYPNGKVTINVDGFTNNGRYVDEKAGIVFGNSAGYSDNYGYVLNSELVINISNFDNSNGIISSLTSDTVNPYIASVTNPESGYTSLKLTVDGVVLVNGIISGTGVDGEEVNKLNALTVDNYSKGNNGSLALTLNNDGTFTVTELTGQTVDYYVVMLKIYASQNNGGTILYTMSEKLSGDNLTTELKNLQIIDKSVATEENGYTVAADINGYAVVEKGGVQYYVYDFSSSYIDGVGTLSVVVMAYDADDSLLASAELSN